MKKFFFTACLISLFIANGVSCANDFASGRDAFNKKDYISANVYFIRALTSNPNDANCRYYYAQTLTYLKNYNQARKEYGYVMMLAPNTQLADYAKQSIAYLDKINKPQPDMKPIIADNYIKKAINAKGELVTWDVNKMPLKIYIDNSKRVATAYVTAVNDALSTWKSSTGGKFDYVITRDSGIADVKILLKTLPDKSEKQVLGLTEHADMNGNMVKATVTLYTLRQNYKQLKSYDVYNVALHEFGHLLGIEGHSDELDDVMHTTYNPDTHTGRMTLSKRDINTAKALYEIDKSPYSSNFNSINKVLGTKEDRMSEKLKESLEYINKVPDNPLGYVNAGQVYLELQNEEKGVAYLKKALEISPDYIYAHKSLAKHYYEKSDLQNAESYCKRVIKAEPKDVQAYYYLSNLYIKNNKMTMARTTINSLLYRNPSAQNDPHVVEVLKKINN